MSEAIMPDSLDLQWNKSEFIDLQTLHINVVNVHDSIAERQALLGWMEEPCRVQFMVLSNLKT
jgi:hypothetical protein